MLFKCLVTVFVVLRVMTSSVHAQTDGSLRGYIKDEQGAVLPGITVTATSPALLAPVSGVTDAGGYYRLLNLPPGTYVVTAELAGFTTYRREGIVMRAGTTFAVDIEMKLTRRQRYPNADPLVRVVRGCRRPDTSLVDRAFNAFAANE